MSLGQLDPEQAPGELRIADLRGESRERGRDLRIKHGAHQPDGRQQNLEILPRGMHHLHDPKRRERAGDRAELGDRDRVDAYGVVARRHLYQAQLRAIGALAEEFGVETDARVPREAGGEIGDGVGSVGDVLQRNGG